MNVTAEQYQALLEARVFEPEAFTKALVNRSRRSPQGADGKLLLVAADHTARGKISMAGDPVAMADRRTVVAALVGRRDASSGAAPLWGVAAVEGSLGVGGMVASER